MKNFLRWLSGCVVVVGVAGGGYWWWTLHQPATTAPQAESTPAPTAAPAAAVPLVQASKPPPAIQYPVEGLPLPSGDGTPLPALDASDPVVKDALAVLLGSKAVAAFLNTDSFLRNATATVDNLARGHAASRLWPVLPTPGHIVLVERSGGTYIADGNADRYAPFVRFAGAIDMAKAATLYVRWYPLFQKAYEELGYPGKYFNDRVVDVVDQLLQTPEQGTPIRVVLVNVQGSVPALRPWVRYEFADAALESRPAGQKILLRMGNANASVLKSKLAEFRSHIVKAKLEK